MSKDWKYQQFAQGVTFRRLVSLEENIYQMMKKAPKKDYYSSLYLYNENHLKKLRENGNEFKGITDVITKRLFFDFDSAQDLHSTKKDSLELIRRLVESGVPEDRIRIYFSGNKGFHIEIPINQELTRQEFVNIVFGLASDLSTFDVRINDEARIVRLALTCHQVSGLYKIPLTIAELSANTPEQIRELAKDVSPYNPDNLMVKPIDLPEILVEMKNREYKKVANREDVEIAIPSGDVNFDVDFSRCPRWMPKERYALQEGCFLGSESTGVGERNIAFMILAATYKAQGYSKEHAFGLLVATADRQAKRTGETAFPEDRIQHEILSAVYSNGWKGGIYGKDEQLLITTRERFKLTEEIIETDLVKIDNVGSDFQTFAKNIDRNTVKTGLKSLDDRVIITSGMMVCLLAAPGAGKTSFANMFVENLSQNNESIMYFSLDMYKNLLFSRLLQKYSGYDMKKILDMYKEDEPDEVLQDAYARVIENYSNAYFNFRSGPTVEEIEQEIINYRQEKGRDVKLVVVDYLEKVRGPFSDATANSAYVASRLSDIAKKYDTVVLTLVQPQKAAGDPRDELTSYRKIKGASVIEQDSRVILTLSRPGYDPKNMDNDKFATISVVKNNMGALCQLDYKWDGVKGSLEELDSQERLELKQLRDQIEKNKVGEFGGGYNKSIRVTPGPGGQNLMPIPAKTLKKLREHFLGENVILYLRDMNVVTATPDGQEIAITAMVQAHIVDIDDTLLYVGLPDGTVTKTFQHIIAPIIELDMSSQMGEIIYPESDEDVH